MHTIFVHSESHMCFISCTSNYASSVRHGGQCSRCLHARESAQQMIIASCHAVIRKHHTWCVIHIHKNGSRNTRRMRKKEWERTNFHLVLNAEYITGTIPVYEPLSHKSLTKVGLLSPYMCIWVYHLAVKRWCGETYNVHLSGICSFYTGIVVIVQSQTEVSYLSFSFSLCFMNMLLSIYNQG